MKYAVTSDEMKRYDRNTSERFGVKPEILMERASLCVADEIEKYISSKNADRKYTVLVFAGVGNNGGDGFVMARHLQRLSFRVDVVAIGKTGSWKGDAAVNLGILERLTDENLEIIYFDRDFFEHSLKELRVRLSQAAIVVDAMLGTGAHGEPRFPIGDIIDCVNSARKRTFAVDIPSGLDGDTGEVVSCAVRAGITCTLGAFKKGFAHHGAQEYTGKIFLADIGVARSKLTKQ